MSNPQQPDGWNNPGGPEYLDPVTGQTVRSATPASYPQYPVYGQPVLVPAQRTNGMAIASLVLSLCGLLSCGVTALVGAILGHVARRQIRERGEDGDGLAMGGIIAGWIIFGLAIVGVGLYVAFIVWVIRSARDDPNFTY